MYQVEATLPESVRVFARLQAGESAAPAEIVDRYANRLTALARRCMSGQLARKMDPEDAVQSALCCFFSQAHDRGYTVDRQGDLWRLLAAITVKRVLKHAERFRAAKRCLDREQDGHCATECDVPRADDVDPAIAAALREEFQRLLDGLHPKHRSILELHLQGFPKAQIAETCNRTPRHVSRVLQIIQTRLEATI